MGLDLLRAGLLLETYNRQRQGGMTDRQAKEIAVRITREAWPKMKVSTSAVDRALSRFQPPEAHEVFTFHSAPSPRRLAYFALTPLEFLAGAFHGRQEVPPASFVRIPRQPGHGFHGNLDSDSRPNWTLIPAQSGQPNSMT